MGDAGHGFRIGLPIECQNEKIAARLKARLDQQPGQTSATRYDAKFTRHSPALGGSGPGSIRHG